MKTIEDLEIIFLYLDLDKESWYNVICDSHKVFFLNQQFITWGAKADHGSYFVTMYRISKLHKERKGERNKTRKDIKEGEKDTNAWNIASEQLWLPNCIIEHKSTAVKL